MARRTGSKAGSRLSHDELLAAFGAVESATLVETPPAGDYSYELKYDGYRILAVKLGDDVRLVSRRGQDWTDEFAGVARAVQKSLPDDVILDGEVVALDERGVPSFQRLQHRIKPHSYVLFDVLWHAGRDVRPEPLEARRAKLEELLAEPKPPLARSSAVQGSAPQLLELACSSGFEGLIGKRVGSPYRPGRGLDWIKLKCEHRQKFVIAGYLPYTGGRVGVVGSLLLALRRGQDYVFAGKVGTGFDQASRAALGELLEARRAPAPRAREVPKFGGLARFVELGLVAEVKFTEWTEGGHARHPSFLGLRPDKRPEDCVREGRLGSPPARPPPDKASKAPDAAAASSVLGVPLSNAERRLTPLPLTKLELARYYEAIADWMLPHVLGRPLTLLRWADGQVTEKGGVYLHHKRAWGPAALARIRIVEQRKVGEYLVVEDAAGLVALAQMDILEIHSWNSTREDVEHPNRLVFDLDPSPELPWPVVVRAARELRALLDGVGLASWPKTTGGKGLHVVVPILPEYDWVACLAASRTIAERFAATTPSAYTTNVQKHARRGKILIDYLRNARGNTSVAAYSTRANENATVSTPLAWSELEPELLNSRFTVPSVRRRVRELSRDPWRDYWKTQQPLLAARVAP